MATTIRPQSTLFQSQLRRDLLSHKVRKRLRIASRHPPLILVHLGILRL